ncbi:MAG TPA: cytochrome c [Solirubrobacterales bacterium]|nr:cytochrome c [Solirubrobacterales bacterium]
MNCKTGDLEVEMRESGSGSVVRVLAALALAALVGVFALSGCGSDSGTTTNETTLSEKPGMSEPGENKEAEEAEAAKEAGKTEASKGEPAAGGEAEAGGEQPAGGGEQLEEGKTVFTTNCAACHTLADAGASGEVGPDLDQLKPDEATVEHQVINGGGPMPAFGSTLQKGEIEAVSKYVSSVAGKG